MSVPRELNSLLNRIKELIALWHWLSNLIALSTALSENGITQGVILWLISSLVSGLIAELIRTLIPSFLRPIFKFFFE